MFSGPICREDTAGVKFQYHTKLLLLGKKSGAKSNTLQDAIELVPDKNFNVISVSARITWRLRDLSFIFLVSPCAHARQSFEFIIQNGQT